MCEGEKTHFIEHLDRSKEARDCRHELGGNVGRSGNQVGLHAWVQTTQCLLPLPLGSNERKLFLEQAHIMRGRFAGAPYREQSGVGYTVGEYVLTLRGLGRCLFAGGIRCVLAC